MTPDELANPGIAGAPNGAAAATGRAETPPHVAAGKGAPAVRGTRWAVWLLVAVDVLMLELCLGLGFATRVSLSGWIPFVYDERTLAGLATGVLMVPPVLLLFGVYPGYGLNDVERLRRVVAATAIVFSILIAWDYLVQRGLWSRGVLLATWAFATVLLPVVFTWTRRLLIGARLWGAPLMVIGARDEAQALIRRLAAHPGLGYVPVGILDFDPALVGAEVAGVPVLGTVREADRWARRIKTAAVVMPELAGDQLAALSARLPFPHVVLLPEYHGLQTSWVTPRDLAGVLGLEVKKNLLLRHNWLVKRAVDVAGAVVLLALFLPLLAFAALAIMAISPGSPFYTHEVVGRGMRPFGMLKLRTMYADARERLDEYLRQNPERRQEWLKYLKLRQDPRILPHVGSFLRKSSIDELPQLINVLRGEMSLVGPRPMPAYELEVVPPEYARLRCSVTPGITGLWQVEMRNDGDLGDREALDTYYIRNWSLWLDIHILFKTVSAVLAGKGAR